MNRDFKVHSGLTYVYSYILPTSNRGLKAKETTPPKQDFNNSKIQEIIFHRKKIN